MPDILTTLHYSVFANYCLKTVPTLRWPYFRSCSSNIYEGMCRVGSALEFVVSRMRHGAAKVPKQNVLNASAAEQLQRIALPEYAKLRKFDYLAALVNGFSTGPSKVLTPFPVVCASLFAATDQICLSTPSIDAEFLNLLAVASTGARVRTIVGNSLTCDNEYVGDFPNLSIQTVSGSDGKFHEKLLLIDGLLAVIGTANFTSYGLHQNVEISYATTDPSLVIPAQASFDQLWNRN